MNKKLLILLSIINIFITIFLIRICWFGSDKSIIILLFWYSALIILYFTIYLILKGLKISNYLTFQKIGVYLLILFVPVVIVASLK